VGETSAIDLPRSYEFRTFWWSGQLVAVTPYWTDVDYRLLAADHDSAIAVAAEAASKIPVTFLVIDVAQTDAGRWIVIECNDGQDSGYRAASPLILWRKVLDLLQPEFS
jgi:hypothetical protein